MIILEQPDNSGKWIPIPPPLMGKVDQTKYDVSSDGKWMKPKELQPPTPDPAPNLTDVPRIFWEKITDPALVEKLKAAGKKSMARRW